MRYIIQFLVLALLVHFTSVFFSPFWIWVILLLFGLFVARNAKIAIFLGFLAVFIPWSILAYYYSIMNEQLLSGRIGELMGGVPSLLLPLISGILGGIGGLLFSWLGASGKNLIR